jgi:hypothetical protein
VEQAKSPGAQNPHGPGGGAQQATKEVRDKHHALVRVHEAVVAAEGAESVEAKAWGEKWPGQRRTLRTRCLNQRKGGKRSGHCPRWKKRSARLTRTWSRRKRQWRTPTTSGWKHKSGAMTWWRQERSLRWRNGNCVSKSRIWWRKANRWEGRASGSPRWMDSALGTQPCGRLPVISCTPWLQWHRQACQPKGHRAELVYRWEVRLHWRPSTPSKGGRAAVVQHSKQAINSCSATGWSYSCRRKGATSTVMSRWRSARTRTGWKTQTGRSRLVREKAGRAAGAEISSWWQGKRNQKSVNNFYLKGRSAKKRRVKATCCEESSTSSGDRLLNKWHARDHQRPHVKREELTTSGTAEGTARSSRRRLRPFKERGGMAPNHRQQQCQWHRMRHGGQGLPPPTYRGLHCRDSGRGGRGGGGCSQCGCGSLRVRGGCRQGRAVGVSVQQGAAAYAAWPRRVRWCGIISAISAVKNVGHKLNRGNAALATGMRGTSALFTTDAIPGMGTGFLFVTTNFSLNGSDVSRGRQDTMSMHVAAATSVAISVLSVVSAC